MQVWERRRGQRDGDTLLMHWEVAAAEEAKLLTEPQVCRCGWLGGRGALRCWGPAPCPAARLTGRRRMKVKRRAPSRRTL